MEETNNQIVGETQQQIIQSTPKDIGHEELIRTLYFLWDGFKRSYMDFFLLRDTAKQALSGKQLSGDHIDVGVRKNEWVSGNKPILDIFFEHEHVTKVKENEEIYEGIYQEVPFTIHLFSENDCLSSLIPLNYEHERWLVPNRFEHFDKEIDK